LLIRLSCGEIFCITVHIGFEHGNGTVEYREEEEGKYIHSIPK